MTRWYDQVTVTTVELLHLTYSVTASENIVFVRDAIVIASSIVSRWFQWMPRLSASRSKCRPIAYCLDCVIGGRTWCGTVHDIDASDFIKQHQNDIIITFETARSENEAIKYYFEMEVEFYRTGPEETCNFHPCLNTFRESKHDKLFRNFPQKMHSVTYFLFTAVVVGSWSPFTSQTKVTPMLSFVSIDRNMKTLAMLVIAILTLIIVIKQTEHFKRTFQSLPSALYSPAVRSVASLYVIHLSVCLSVPRP